MVAGICTNQGRKNSGTRVITRAVGEKTKYAARTPLSAPLAPNISTLRTISSQLTNGNDRDGTVSRSGIMVPHSCFKPPGGTTTGWGFSLPAVGEEPGRSRRSGPWDGLQQQRRVLVDHERVEV